MVRAQRSFLMKGENRGWKTERERRNVKKIKVEDIRNYSSAGCCDVVSGRTNTHTHTHTHTHTNKRSVCASMDGCVKLSWDWWERERLASSWQSGWTSAFGRHKGKTTFFREPASRAPGRIHLEVSVCGTGIIKEKKSQMKGKESVQTCRTDHGVTTRTQSERQNACKCQGCKRWIFAHLSNQLWEFTISCLHTSLIGSISTFQRTPEHARVLKCKGDPNSCGFLLLGLDGQTWTCVV